MKAKQIQTKNSPLSLRVKIATGYLLLILLFGIIVWMVWTEKQKIGTLNAGERAIHDNRRIVNRTFELLLDLSFSDDFLLSGDTAALAVYRAKRISTVSTLEKLKAYYPASDQQTRIDSVCSLLKEKEVHLYKVMETLSAQSQTDEWIRRRIPYIASQAHDENETPAKKKGGIFGLFRKKEKNVPQKNAPNTSALLYSLGREVHDKQQEQQAQLTAYSDSLHHRNIQLNSQLSQIIRAFEAEAMQHMEREHARIIRQREHSFRLISLTTLTAVFLVLVLYIFIHRDITEKNIYRKKLEASDRKKEELLHARKNMMLTVSHDLRAPLTAINGYAELLPDERKKENRTRYSDAIRQSSDRMLSLLNSLLHYYRLDMGKDQPERIPFRLRSIADTLAAEYAPTVARKRLEFITEYDGGDVIVTGDRERILQIASNLLSNAAKFTSAGYIRLGLSYADGFVTLRVEDTGSGMTQKQSALIFEPFTRLNNAETDEGFGLGLSITLALVELLDGTITVESRPGAGSTFTVRLPLYVCTEENIVSQNTLPETLPVHLRVVVVDNDAMLLAMTMEMFSRYKVHAEGCHSARELMERLRTHDFDLIVTDIMMPDVNGFGLLELLRTSNITKARTVPVVAMTARAERSADEFIRAGFAGCLYKPFSRAELFATVSRCIGEQTKAAVSEANFSVLLSGEDNGKEMLDLLARETERNMTFLSEGFEKGDRETVTALTHQLLPLWETLRIDAPLKELWQMLSVANMTDETMHAALEKVLAVGGQLIVQAKEQGGRL
ncbi:ATP-binding response regulator [Phocaeicola sp.]